MKEIYLEVLNDQSQYIWVKFILNKYNELTLDSIVTSLNQRLINADAVDVFFKYPNILFTKVDCTLYKNNSDISTVKSISSIEHSPVFTQSFSSYYSFKDAIINLVLKKKGENNNNNGSNSDS